MNNDPNQQSKQVYSLKGGGRQGAPGLGNHTSNVFALGAASSSKQDRSYYKSLYHFNADVELAEYSLPVLANQQPSVPKHGQPTKLPSGVINSTQLPPIQQKNASEKKGLEGSYDEEHPIDEEEDMENAEEIEDEMNGDMDPYGEEDEDQMNRSLTFDEFREIIENNEDASKSKAMQARMANFIRKGTPIYEMLIKLKSGEQAISFFAQHGNSTPIKFLNCNRTAVAPHIFRPYDLAVLMDEKNVRDEYFTVSAQGVVHICPEKGKKYSKHDAVPTEFFSLSDWMQQSTMFNVLTSMKFFKHYLIGKVFSLWKGNVRFKMYNRTRQNLARNLIFSRPAFLGTFMEINKTLFEMKSVQTFIVPKVTSKVYEIEDFFREQKNDREVVKQHYNDKVEEIMKKLDGLISQVGESRTLREEEDLEHAKMGQQTKNKSMVLQKQEDELKARVLRLAKRNYHSLGTFIRLVDYMVVETQVKINQESADLILFEMKNTTKYSIQTIATYDTKENGLQFNPTKNEFFTQFDKLLGDMLSVMYEVVRVINNPNFNQFIQGLISDSGPKFKQIVETSFSYLASKDHIQQKVEQCFKELQPEVQKIENCRDVNEFEQNFDFEEFRSQHSDLETIRGQLEILNKWDQSVSSSIKNTYLKGFINILGKKLKDRLSKKVKDEHKAIKQYLFDLADQKGKDIIKGFEKIKITLNKAPHSLTTYVEYCNNLKMCQNQRDNMIEEKKRLEDMNTALRKYKLKDDQQQTFNTSQQLLLQKLELIALNIQEVDQLFQESQGSCASQKDGFVEELDRKINEEKDKITGHLDKIGSETLMSKATPFNTALEELSKTKKKFDESCKRLNQYKSYQETLDINPTPIKEIDDFTKKFDVRQKLWKNRDKFAELNRHWYYDYFTDLDANEVVQIVKDYEKDNLLLKQQLPRDQKDEVLEQLQTEVKMVSQHCNLISALGNKTMLPRHWAKIFALFESGAPPPTNKQFSLQQLLSEGIDQHYEKVEEISSMASGEASIEQTLNEIINFWLQAQFTVLNYRDFKDRFIIGEIEDTITQLEDHSMSIQTMMGSKHVTEIRPLVESWEKRLGTYGYIIDEWLTFQRQWMYLENIFNAEDIQKQLPVEAKQFQQVDKFWRDHMMKSKKSPQFQELDKQPMLLTRFEGANKSLEEIQKKLEDYLETKRTAFPRFYFLSNDELLEILSQTRNVHAVQPHLRKCFDNIMKIEFKAEKNSKEILGMWSAETEYVTFSESVFAEGNVEFWLMSIEKMMVKSLYDQTKQAFVEYPADPIERNEWLFSYPAQPVLTIDQVKWTFGVTAALGEIMRGKNKKALEEFLEESIKQINKMVELVKGQLTRLERSVIGALVVLDVHARDVVRQMIKARVESINDFEWTKQLRYYWEQDEEIEDCFARQTNTRFRYGYEYLGNGPRLVITPLTDKCYMTLTGALHLNYGGNPQGPAGTGKTETTKDLAKALAIQCVVFNCSDGLDFKMMGRFFSGLAQGGAWACFDEFNRIDIEVLSVIAQQILTIQSAVRAKSPEVEFNEKLIPLNLRFGVFITMNPGYAGRTELPDNLKSLFRPISMMIPDYRLIAQIILFSEGFSAADDLARKMVQLYKLSSEQLSKQDHYDFGMRAVKSVLVMAGSLRRKNPDTPEDIVLIRAMRDSNVPKFLEHDLPLFEGIVTDLFPGVTVPSIDYGQLQIAIEHQLREKQLQTPPKYVKKVIQLLETMMVRHGVMLVGLTGTGKTTCCKVLAKALAQLKDEGHVDPWYKSVHIDTLNPKSVTMGELFGETNVFTNEWTEGLVSKLVKDAVAALETDKADQKRWLNFDGPVDALWIENMNTVLDDNKMLCLMNGQRIKMPETCTMMFEVQDLRVASPATVSRCGMVYLEPIHLGWEPLVDTWKEKMAEIIPHNHLESIIKNVKKVFNKLLPFIREECKESVESVNSNLVQSCLKLVQCFLSPENLDIKKITIYPEKVVLTYLVYSMIWSIGGNLHDSSRRAFSQAFKSEILSIMPEFPDGDIYEYGIDQTTHKFEPWIEQIPNFEFDPNKSFFEILVPTSDTVKYKFILKTLMYSGYNVLLTGETGVGKSVITKDFLIASPENIVYAFVNFSGKTTTKNLQDAFEGNLEAKRKTLLGPPGGKKMIFFIDDVNMPQLDTYGSQPPCELLRQTIDSTGFYDTKKLIFKQIKDTKFVCACAPPGGGRNAVTPRLFRHFNMIWVPDLSSNSMKTIFTAILKGFLDLNEQSGLNIFAEPLIKSSVDIYLKTIKDFLPTPAKCHYTFNLRDLSKVVQGMLMINLENLVSKDYLVYLWVNETYRVFRDRLVDEKDRDKFNTILHDIMEDNLSMEWKLKNYKDVLFGDFETGDKQYLKLSETNVLIPTLDEQLEMYNSDNPKMSLVFFSDCIQHLARISRVLRQQRGNSLLVGVGGSGRSSMAKLAASMNQMKSFSIEISKNYREKEFHEDIKKMLMKSGVEGEKQVFLFSDTQIVKESFLEDINNLLNSGEVPNLFPAEEKAQICDELAPKAREAKQGESRDQIYSYFVQLCRENLHIVLAFSPVGEQFRNRCRQFPSIINCCTIDWYNPWPQEALYSVAHRSYSEKEHELGISDYMDVLCQMSVEIHSSVAHSSDKFFAELRRRNYTTPTSYLDLIKTYISMLKYQRGIVPIKIARYQGGLTRLAETNKMVDDLKAMLIKLRPEIDRKEEETQKLVVDLEKQQKIATEQEKYSEKEEAETQKLFNEVMVIKTECEGELQKAMPIYREALAALNTLNKGDIIEMKSYAKPPEDLVLVVSAVCLIMGSKETWDEAKKLMNQPEAFITSLKEYDKDKIKESTLKKLKKYTQDPRFVPSLIEKKSQAGKSLCLWAKAIDNYAEVMKIIKPKQEALGKAEGELKVAQDELRLKQASLQKIRDMIASLQANYSASQRKLEDLTRQKEKIEVQLQRAEKLVVGLADESKRWGETVKILDKDLVNLIGNIIIAAGYISYVGTFTFKYRDNLLKEWMSFCKEKKIPFSNDFSVERILGDPVQIRDWNINGLPADYLSVENGLFVTQAKRWPLMIDPQSQGNKWIKNMEKDNNLQVIKLSYNKFLQVVENGVRMGNPVLLENIDESLDPSLEPLLTKNLQKQAGQECLRLGDNWVPYNKDFKFFITTKLANPHYLPEICIKVTIINFTVTPEGLEDQLLVDVVKYEQPDLEQQKDQLVVQLSDFKRQLKELEDKILKLVSEAGSDILDDEELIITLDQSKQTSTNINEKMIDAEKTAILINENREKYRNVAKRGSVLYFVIADLAMIDPMYQYSLEFFSRLFNRRLDKSEKSDQLDKRLSILISDITESFFINICRGLFERDKLLYSFLNASSILRRSGAIGVDEWNFFLRGSVTDFSSYDKDIDYVSEAMFFKLLGLEETHYNFKDISQSFKDRVDAVTWKDILKSEDPHLIPLPQAFEDRLTSFQKLMLIKVMREEKLMSGIKEFVKSELGDKFIESPAFDLMGAYSDSVNTSPVIFVLSPGADPITYLVNLAKSKNMDARLKILSLGQGQGEIARRLIEQGQLTGDWVCLQNCHLSASWMPELEKIQEKQNEAEMHPEYRLWLTSMPSKNFPVPVLQSGIKITNEPPKGLKANLKGTFNEVTEQDYESCSKPREYKKLLFALAYFHAVILERRKYGAIGWNIPYEWMNSDFITSKTQLKMYLDEQPEIPYVALNYLCAEVNYGGRVTDDKDIRLIKALLKKYFCAEIMNDNYKLSKLEHYYAPYESPLSEIKNYINLLPLEDDPEVFGLHPNANITFEQKTVREFMDTILVIQPRISGGKAVRTSEEIVQDLAREIVGKLPKILDKKKANEKTFAITEQGQMISLGVFVGQEIDRFNKLLSVMKSTLVNLDKAIEGTVVMSMELEMMFNSFINNKVPGLWEKVGYPSLKPLSSWVVDLILRVDFMGKWLYHGPPSTYWLPAFFFPQGFMTATLQQYARKTQTPIDTLAFKTHIKDHFDDGVKEAPEDGVNIHGLFFQGAKWDFKKKMVEDSDPKVPIVKMPVIWLEPVLEKEVPEEKIYHTPLYKTSVRAGELSTTGHSTNFVLFLHLSSDIPQDYWIRRGAALLCMTDD